MVSCPASESHRQLKVEGALSMELGLTSVFICPASSDCISFWSFMINNRCELVVHFVRKIYRQQPKFIHLLAGSSFSFKFDAI